MVDVCITFSPDRAAAAERLRQAISAAGYDVSTETIRDVEELIATDDRHRSGIVTLLIWSRSLASSALRPGKLRQLRRQGKLIEVSPDGVAPQADDGDNHVILISGWRGQPFHPGWQRIESDLKRLCGPPAQVAEPAVIVGRIEPPAARQAVPTEAKASSRPSRFRGGALALVAGVALFGAGFGAASWMASKNPEPDRPRAANMQVEQPEPEPLPVAQSPKAPIDADRAGSVPPQAPEIASSPPAAGEPGLAAAAPAPAVVPTPAPATPRLRQAAAKGSESASRRPRSGAPARAETKRYSRRNSETMRLFCEGSGRSTPQCKTFLQSVRGNRR